MAREKPRSPEEIDGDLDAWLSHREEIQAALSGLKESLQNLQNRFPSDGTFPLPAEHTTRLENLETHITALQAELTQANGTVSGLRSELDDLRAAKPKTGADPSQPPQNEPPEPRKTRTGLAFL